jgi:glycosyltransferase involved in cell wall biosynthesis
LSQLGVSTRLFVHPDASWPRQSLPEDTVLVPTPDHCAVAKVLAREAGGWLIGQGPLPPATVAAAKSKGWLTTAIAHMPVHDRNPNVFAGHDRIFAVSGWVLAGLQEAGLPAWPEPLYGVADLNRSVNIGQLSGGIFRTSRYDWDQRKFRDQLLSWIEPAVEPFLSHPRYEKRSGLTLGIVSRLTPIKQFPRLFECLAPVLARIPSVNVEIFGSGGYASVRDLTRSLVPLTDRVRFWGNQGDVVPAYQNIDYLLSGLPEKEALGLNIIEAQACGTPVIAVDAPPFTETVLNGETGFLYRDPRQDAGSDFGRLLDELLAGRARPKPELADTHLARFSFDAFVERLRPIVADAELYTSRE